MSKDLSGKTQIANSAPIIATIGLTSEPESIVKEPLGEKDVHLFKSPGHHRNWLECIRSRERPVADVEIGARSVTVCHLANLAYWNRRKLRWDPKN